MVAPVIVWGGMFIGGALASGWALEQGEEALDATARLAKWSAVGAGLYVSYRALKSAGAIK